MLATPDHVNFSDTGARLACCAPPRALVCCTRVDSNHPPPHILIHHPHRRHTPTDYPGEYGKSYYRSFDQLTYLFSQFLTILRTTFVVVCWVVMRLVVEPLEALVSDFSASSAGAYLRRCEQTAGAASSSSLCEAFDRMLPLRLRFPRERVPARAVEAQIEEVEVAERV
jgi:hypothetical protein